MAITRIHRYIAFTQYITGYNNKISFNIAKYLCFSNYLATNLIAILLCMIMHVYTSHCCYYSWMYTVQAM